MQTIKLICLLGLAAMLTWSCSNPTSSDNDVFASAPYANATMVSPADSLMGLAQQIPGFGGLFINDSDQLSVYLTNPAGQKAKAKAVLSNSELIREALSNTSASVENMAIKKGQYTFIQLDKWKKEISSKVLSKVDSNYAIGIDQSQNRISVGVESKAVKDNLTNRLADMNISEEAVGIYKVTIEFPIGH